METRLTRLCGLFVVVLMLGSVVLASCTPASAPPAASGTTSPQATAPATTPTVAATPTPAKPTGKIVATWGNAAGIVDPQLASASAFSTLGVAIFDSLQYLNDKNQASPSIAERYEISADGLTHTFFIRKGVKFHNGDPLTAADVKFSMDRMLTAESLHMDAPAWRGVLDSVEVKDDYTVVQRMKTPTFELLKGEGMGGMWAVVPKKYIEEKGAEFFRKNPVGSGSWKFLKFDEGHSLDLEANESHWRVVPKFKNLTLLNVPEEATKIAMLKTGELDVADIAHDSVAGLKSAGVKVLNYDGDSGYSIHVLWDQNNPDKYLFGDVRVRKAMQWGINSKEIVDAMFGGQGGPQFLAYLSSNAYFFDASVLKADPYDPEGAKKLLAEAGRPNGFNTKVWDTGLGKAEVSLVTQAAAGQLRKIGITSEFVPIEYATFYTKIRPKPQAELFDTLWGWGTNALWQFDALVTLAHSSKGFFGNLKNPQLDQLIDTVPKTKDPVEKKKLALQAALMAQQEYNSLRVVRVNNYVGVSAKIHNANLAPYTRALTGWNEMLKSVN